MIYTVTPNPSLDYLMTCPELLKGQVNRSVEEKISVGGKGINVSIMLKELGKKSKIFGFSAGFTGRELERRINEIGICSEFVKVSSGNTRINVKIADGITTEINAKGFSPSEEDVELLCQRIFLSVENGDVLVLSGSVPAGASKGLYERICRLLANKNVKIVVDASGDELISCLKYKPYFVKPNKAELEEILGAELKTIEDIIDGAKKIRKLGARNVVVSMGSEGALLLGENDKIITTASHKISAVSTVGAGDSMVAGIIVGMEKGEEYALKLGNACGAATAASEFIAKSNDVFTLIDGKI